MNPIILSTAAVPLCERFDYWHEVIGRSFVRQEVEFDKQTNGEFNGAVVQHLSGVLNLSEVIAAPHSTIRSRKLISESSEECVLVLFQEHGITSVEQDGRSTLLNAGDIVMCDATKPYNLSLLSNIHHTVIKLAYAKVRATIGGIEHLTAIGIPSRCGAAYLLWQTMALLKDKAHEIEATALSAISDSLVDLTTAAFSNSNPNKSIQPNNLEQYHRDRVRSFALEHLRDPELSVDMISQAIKLSPRYIHRLFSNEDTTLMRWILQQRLEACRRDFCDPASQRKLVSTIAYQWGFNDVGHFSRTFSKVYGIPPRDYKHKTH